MCKSTWDIQLYFKAEQMNNDTRGMVEQTYLDLQQQIQDFNYNMSLKKEIIEEAQEAVRNPSSKRRKREGFATNPWNQVISLHHFYLMKNSVLWSMTIKIGLVICAHDV